MNAFWKLWRDEYLLSLRERHHRQHSNPRIQSEQIPKVGDIVQIKEDLMPRGSWKLGKIKRLNPSHDGEVRSVQVQLANGKDLNRPVNLLFPLECGTDEEATKEDTQREIPSSKVDVSSERPKRLAAVKARTKIKECINSD